MIANQVPIPRLTVAALLAVTLLSALPVGAAPPPPLVLDSRRDPDTGTEVRFGRADVFENRATREGRVLHLDVVVLPATGPDPAPDPIFHLQGGPGLAAAGAYPAYLRSWMREKRDIVFVSQRGTGGSNRLACPDLASDDDLQSYLEPVFRIERFRACLERLREHADLRLYSTPIAMDDLDEIRARLGYAQINLVGGSYGSRAALVYLRRHPERVRTAVLNGIAPIAFTNPAFHARAAQDALDLIIAECAGRPGCLEAFGDLEAKFEMILARLDARPADVTLTHPRTGAKVPGRLTRDAFAGAFRILMYWNSRDVPWLIEQAFTGNYDVFAQRGMETNRSLLNAIAFGMLFCVTCSEDVPRIDPAAIPGLTEGTFLGDGRVRGQIEICGIWPRSDLPPDFGEPVRAVVPVLLLSGTLDPVTPPRFGEEAARHLPQALHLVVPGSHGVGGPCIDAITRAFLEAGTIEGLDTGCTERMQIGFFRAPG